MIHHRRKIRKKSYILITIILVQGFFLYYYSGKEDLLNNLNFYSIKNAYIPALKYKLTNGFYTIRSKEEKIVIPVLNYHGIVDRDDGSNVLVRDFLDQMMALKRDGWKTIGLDDYYAFIKGEVGLPDKSFLLTFDDGRKDSYYPVDPILKALDYNAVLFVITENLEQRSDYYLSRKELKKMIKSRRWEIQPHTKHGQGYVSLDNSGRKGHFYSNRIWKEDESRLETEEEFEYRIKTDMTDAKSDIENVLNLDVISFAFPFGDYGQDSINYPESISVINNIALQLFPINFYQSSSGGEFLSNRRDYQKQLVNRISVKKNWSAENLISVVNSSRLKVLPFDDKFNKYSGWIKTGGVAEMSESFFVLKSGRNNSGSIFLNGTQLWQDFAFESRVAWNKGSNVLLLARYRDDNNYVACNFGQSIARVESRINGENEILKEEKMIPDISKNNLNLGIRVYDRKIQCLLDNKIIIEVEKNDNYLEDGGIGFKTWDKELGNSELLIHEVAISESSWENKEKYVQPELADEDKNKKAEEKIIEKKNLPFVALPVSLEQGWKKSWGEIDFSSEGMIMKPAANGTGGLVFLEGAEEWTNYSFVSMINWVNGSNFVILSRFKDGNNYLAFNVGKEFIRLEKYVNGKSKIIKEVPNDLKLNKNDIIVKINVTGNRVTCFIGDKLILEDSNDISELSQGGIGFKVWDKKLNNSEIIIKQVEVAAR